MSPHIPHMFNSALPLSLPPSLPLSHPLSLHQVETIGDAYMVAAGLLDTSPQHAEAVTNMAFDMREAASLVTTPHTSECIQVETSCSFVPVCGTYLSVSVCLSVSLFVHLSVCLSVYSLVHLSVSCLSVCLFVLK